MCQQFDIIMIQEHWLYPDELSYLSMLSNDFSSFGLSPMPVGETLLSGRPYGGVGIMWHKKLSNCAKIVQFDDNRILGLEIKTNNQTFLFVCIYLPCDCDANYDDYCFYLNKIHCIIDSASTPHVFILGDFNANINSDSLFGKELIEFCDINRLCFTDKNMLLPNTYTFFSQAHGSTSWLDHCITTASSQSIISNMYVNNDIVCSDHFPLCIDIDCDIPPIYNETVVNCQRNVYKWQFANDINLCDYELNTHKLANDIIIPYDALCCRITNCTLHNSDIDCFYNALISVLHKSAEKCIPTSVLKSGNYNTIPGWNDYVKEHHIVAKDALSLWRFNNKPKFGPVYHSMRVSRARFKYALRYTKYIEDTARADALAKDLCDNDHDDFWKGVRKLNQCNNIQANCIEGKSGENEIAIYWKDYFCKLLNTNKINEALKSSILDKLEGIQYTDSMSVSTVEVSDTISTLKKGKACGPDGICAEALKSAHHKVYVLLSLCFSLCMSHGYIPQSLIETTIVPIIKNKAGDLSSGNNYRPIALANVISKVFESLILLRCEQFLTTADNQFGFKSRHSTDFCIYTLKEYIEFYKLRNTSVFVTFLDASKAFDRIDHWLLFKKLIDKRIPLFIIKLLVCWYSTI